MIKRFYLVGVLGSGMLALAKLLLDKGMHVAGEDLQTRSKQLPDWVNQIEFLDELMCQADIVVYSTAIQADHPTLVQAKKLNKTLLHRSEAIDYITRQHQLVSVTGTHGKTSCSALLSWIFMQAGEQPAYYIGGKPSQFEAADAKADSRHFILEADESDGSLLNYQPHSAMITNIEPDHLEHHNHSFAQYIACFETFMQGPEWLVMNADDPVSQTLIQQHPSLQISTIGYAEKSDYQLQPVRYEQQKPVITVKKPDGLDIELRPQLTGQHNVYNVAMCWLMAHLYGIEDHYIKQAIHSFTGVARRNTTVGHLNFCNHSIPVIDDYGHHPTECKLLLEELKRQNKHIIHVCEPHRFSRFNYFFDAFKTTLMLADETILLPVFAAGENKADQLDSHDMQQALNIEQHGCQLFSDIPTLYEFIQTHHQANSVILCQGAGHVTQIAHALVQHQYATT